MLANDGLHSLRIVQPRHNIHDFFFFSNRGDHRELHSFPTRRSSDLRAVSGKIRAGVDRKHARHALGGAGVEDRKSTRLNSSHVRTSYAVFCLKKKTTCETKPQARTSVNGQSDRRHATSQQPKSQFST